MVKYVTHIRKTGQLTHSRALTRQNNVKLHNLHDPLRVTRVALLLKSRVWVTHADYSYKVDFFLLESRAP